MVSSTGLGFRGFSSWCLGPVAWGCGDTEHHDRRWSTLYGYQEFWEGWCPNAFQCHTPKWVNILPLSNEGPTMLQYYNRQLMHRGLWGSFGIQTITVGDLSNPVNLKWDIYITNNTLKVQDHCEKDWNSIRASGQDGLQENTTFWKW